MLETLTGSWLDQPAVASMLIHTTEHFIKSQLGSLGFTARIHCAFRGYRPDDQHSGWQMAGKLTCTMKQYVTAP